MKTLVFSLALLLGACTQSTEEHNKDLAKDAEMKVFEVYKSEKAAHRVHKLYRDYLNSWPIAHEEKFVTTLFGDTFVIESGPKSSPALVMLHGTMATAAMWREEVFTLSKEYHVFAVDVIGDAGFSAPVRPSTNTDAHALWLQDVLKALGQPNAHFVGLSLGGWLALDFAVRYPDQVNSLTLITPGGVADKNIIVWALPMMLLGSWGAEKVRERIVGRSQTPETAQQTKLSEFSTAIFEGMKPRTESLRKISDDELAALDIPVLVLLGADDVTMDSIEIERRFRRLVSHAEIKMFPGKRHFLGNQSEAISGFLRDASRILE
jgi:pimeloyl-ACP methyl ester carboxylesterase